MFGAADCNGYVFWLLYQGRNSNMRVPHHMIFASANRRRRESGSGHMKSLLYETAVPSVEDLNAQICVTTGRIHGMPGIFLNVGHAATLSGLPDDFWS
ncbi:hypothetical protein TNCV_1533501 [Trichonephila clavipes]|nr:hypothetical protein TNCV_1533501 [Trichonephila clavipes]